MKLSVVIPSYNGEENLKKNLPKVLDAIDISSFEIIIVDDFSTDDSVGVIGKFVDQYPSKIILIKNEENMGFSSTVNKGVKKANGEIILLLNTDVNPHKGFLTPLLDDLKDESVFAVGCMDESVEGGSVVNRGRGVGKWARGFLVHSAGNLEKNNTLWVSGGSGAFRKEIWDKLGGLDELYNPFYWEDIDLSYRALKSGYKTVFENRSIVRHDHDKGSIKTFFKESAIKKISYRNQIIFVWLNITDIQYFVSHILFLPYHLLKTLLKGDYLFIWGLILAIKELPKIINKRKQRQKMFTLSDREILLPFSSELTK